MTVFRTYFKIAKKYTGNIFMYTAIFLSIAILMAKNNASNTAEDFAESKVNLAVFCHDESELSEGLVSYLEEKHTIIELENDLDVFRDALYQREVAYILTIPAGFGAQIAEASANELLEVYKLPGSISSQFLDLSIETFLSTYQAYLAAGLSGEDAYQKTVATIEKESDVTVYAKETATDVAPIHYFYHYLPYGLISVIILSIGPILFVFQNEQRKDRIRCSKISNLGKNSALLAASGVYTLAIVVLYCILSIVVYRGEFFNPAGMFRFVNVLIHAFVCLAFTFLFSMLVKTSAMLNMFSNVLGLGSSFLCGIFVPRAMLAPAVASFGRFLPAYWYVNVEEELSGGITAVNSTIATGYLIQILYGVTVLVIALVISQRRKSA